MLARARHTALLLTAAFNLLPPLAHTGGAEADVRIGPQVARLPERSLVEHGVPESAGRTSLEVLRQDEPVFMAPTPRARRRGSLAREAVLPIFEVRDGPGCEGRWLRVGMDAWLCEQHVKVFSRQAPNALALQPQRTTLPFRYWFVGPDGAQGYQTLSSAERVAPDVRWEPGFVLATVTSASLAREPYALTTKGFWVALRSLKEVQPPDIPLHDFVAESGRLPGWVLRARALVYSAPGVASREKAPARWSKVTIYEDTHHAGQAWVRHR